MYNTLFGIPKTQNEVTVPISYNPSEGTQGSHFSVNSVGGYYEVMYLSDLDTFSEKTGVSFDIDDDSSILYLSTDNISSGKRRLGMLVYVYETDTVYQHQITNYIDLFTAATASTVVTARMVVFNDYDTWVYSGTNESNALINAWFNSSIEGISGTTRTNAGWRLFTAGGSSSLPFVHISGDTMTGSLSVPSVYTPIIYLGSDSSGNTRTITADGSVLDFDVLDGGFY